MKGVIGGLALAGVLLLAAPSHADISSLPPSVAAGIAAMGPHLDREIIDKTAALMKPVVPAALPTGVRLTKDVAYGSDSLQTIDVYQPATGQNLPIAIYVHGGGFTGGDKNGYGQFYGNIPAYLARHGIIGVNANYRLAPKVAWPAESDDVGAVVTFMTKSAAQYGGDPKRIFLIGHSAGANLVASYAVIPSLHPRTGAGIAGAVVVSIPAYHAASVSPPDHAYLGDDASKYPARAPETYLKDSKIPFMIVAAEFDPIVLAAESYDMAAAVCRRDGKCPVFVYMKGHNHISETMSVGSRDDTLARALVDFVTNTR